MEDSGDSALRVVKSFIISKEEDQCVLKTKEYVWFILICAVQGQELIHNRVIGGAMKTISNVQFIVQSMC